MATKLRAGKSTSPKAASRLRRHVRVRKKLFGTPQRPRLVVTKSARHLSAQVVDDTASHTLVSASTMETDLRGFDGDKTARARRVGELIAERATASGLDSAVFDRAGHRYHGRIAALADGARAGGLAL